MFQICVHDQKVQRKNRRYDFEFFLNVRSIKMHTIFYIIEISKSIKFNKFSMDPNKCTLKILQKCSFKCLL